MNALLTTIPADRSTAARFFRKMSWAAAVAALVVLPLGLQGCKDGGREFRNALRGAADSLGKGGSRDGVKGGGSSDARMQQAKANSIPSCPENAKLQGHAFPLGLAQWCETAGKDGKAVKHGEFRRWHTDGKLKYQASYENGVLAGILRKWDKGGKLLEESAYLDGQLHGMSKIFNRNGSKKTQAKYVNGKKHGPFMAWAKGDRPKEKGYFSEDEKIGVWTTYSNAGYPVSKITYNAGKKHGKAELYGKDGSLRARGTYQNDVEHGQWIAFQNNGQKKSEGSYAEGRKNGPWTEYNSSGAVAKTVVYRQGIVVQDITPQYARADAPQKIRYPKFGNGDILGDTPPVRRNQQAPAIQTPAVKSEKAEAWEPM